jgi:hypothetical protein
VLISIELRSGDGDGVVGVAEIVVDGPAPGAPTEKLDTGSQERGVGGFEPGVLVAAEDYGGGVAVEEEGSTGGGESGEEVVFEG